MLILQQLKKLSELSSSELGVLLIAMIYLPLTACALKIKGFNWTQSALNRHSPKINSQITISHQLLEAKSIARMVVIAANHGPYRANCLKKSLVTWWLLARRGIQSELKIGVNKEEGSFNAHSWVEFQGAVVNDATDIDHRFSTFDSKRL
jgi:hypothetical protein